MTAARASRSLRPRPNIEDLETLPELLRPGLDLVFVGINPGERSAERGHYYGHPGNAFWRRLSASPLVSREVTADDDSSLQDGIDGGLAIGFTDVVKRVITDSTQITNAEMQDALDDFHARIRHASPRAVCFTATRPFEAVYPGQWRARGWGRQDVPSLEGASVWVMPSPSGRAAGYHGEIERVLVDLAAWLADRRHENNGGRA
jgi:double-stranded uracil-DNA glycosylase